MPANIVDTTRSPHARLRPVPLTAVTLLDTFWEPRRRLNHEVTLPSQYRQCEATGRIDNFRRAAGKLDVEFQGAYYNDSDVYKWVEAAAWSLADTPGDALRAMLAAVITEIAAAQQPNGYLNSYFMFEQAAERWSNLRDKHELYCAGHLIQAAIACHRALGDDVLFGVARRLADHICATFGPEEAGKRPGVCGHEEIEMALVELARETGEERYLRQAQYFIDARGHGLIGGGAYVQDHQPLRDMERLDGHAVRAVYLMCAGADLCAETGEPALRAALERLWTNMTTRRMYLGGGLGARYEGEAFGDDYELPNQRAYAESCAGIGNIMWNWRMLSLTGDARYADVMEQALYNNVLAGLSLDGEHYFYQNPLASDGSHRRQPWFGCACCPPNIARLLASLPGYFYSTNEEGVWIHLYAEGGAELSLPDGHTVQLRQRTNYPWEGEVEIEVLTAGEFTIWFRLPGWCETGAAFAINDVRNLAQFGHGVYLPVRKQWQAGDIIQLQLPMPVRLVESHPLVAENLGRVALMRGPLLYCLEAADNPAGDLRAYELPAEAGFAVDDRTDLPGGIKVIHGEVEIGPVDIFGDWLYRTAMPRPQLVPHRHAKFTAIPYYAWANREPGQMQVWLRRA